MCELLLSGIFHRGEGLSIEFNMRPFPDPPVVVFWSAAIRKELPPSNELQPIICTSPIWIVFLISVYLLFDLIRLLCFFTETLLVSLVNSRQVCALEGGSVCLKNEPAGVRRPGGASADREATKPLVPCSAQRAQQKTLARPWSLQTTSKVDPFFLFHCSCFGI